MPQVVLLSGVPGSGKSTYTRALQGRVVVCSADHWFERSGSYQFAPHELPQAHGACLRRFTEALQANDCDVLVVDNTNTSVVELAPYYALAAAYGAPVRLVTVTCDPTVAHSRNTHGVPLVGVQRMAEAIRNRLLPPFWEVEQVSLTTG